MDDSRVGSAVGHGLRRFAVVNQFSVDRIPGRIESRRGSSMPSARASASRVCR